MEGKLRPWTDMTKLKANNLLIKGRTVVAIPLLLAVIGLAAFMVQLSGAHPDRAWQAYLINFLLWSAVAQGGLLFSTVTRVTKARWSRPLQDIAESFVAFFPFSLGLFLLLFLTLNFIYSTFFKPQVKHHQIYSNKNH